MKKLAWSASVAVIWAVAVIPISDSHFFSSSSVHKPNAASRSYHSSSEEHFYTTPHPINILPSYGGKKYKKKRENRQKYAPHYKPKPGQNYDLTFGPSYGPNYDQNSGKPKNHGPSYERYHNPHSGRQGNYGYIDQNTNDNNVLDLITGYFKNFVHREKTEDRNLNLFGVNYVAPSRKNQLDRDDNVILVIVPNNPEMLQSRPRDELPSPENSDYMARKNQLDNNDTILMIIVSEDPEMPRSRPIFPGYTQSKPRDEHQFLEDSYSFTRPEHLPEAQPVHPGHTLLRPSRGMLKPSVKYPLTDFGGSAVYGNLENQGITFGKSSNRIRYSDFKKTDSDFLEKYRALSTKSNGKKRTRPLMVLEIDPAEIEAIKNLQMPVQNLYSSEVLDDLDALLVQDDNDDYKPMKRRR